MAYTGWEGGVTLVGGSFGGERCGEGSAGALAVRAEGLKNSLCWAR